MSKIVRACSVCCCFNSGPKQWYVLDYEYRGDDMHMCRSCYVQAENHNVVKHMIEDKIEQLSKKLESESDPEVIEWFKGDIKRLNKKLERINICIDALEDLQKQVTKKQILVENELLSLRNDFIQLSQRSDITTFMSSELHKRVEAYEKNKKELDKIEMKLHEKQEMIEIN